MRARNTLSRSVCCACIAFAWAADGRAQCPVPPLAELGSGLEVMNHVFITRSGPALFAWIERPGDVPLRMYRTEPGAFCSPFDVVNDRWTNGQFGWLISGFWNVPPGTFVWFESLVATPYLDVYHERRYANGSYGVYEPIFGTQDQLGVASDDAIFWDFAMLHNQYAADHPGVYTARYRVYLGDASGQSVPGFTDAEIELTWIAGEPDVDQDNDVDPDDISAWLAAPTDVNVNGETDFFDALDLVRAVDLADLTRGSYVAP